MYVCYIIILNKSIVNQNVSVYQVIDQQEKLLPITTWLSDIIIGLIFAGMRGWLLKQEYNHIEIGDAKYTTKYLKLWSLLCIVIGLLSQLLSPIGYLPILCHGVFYVRYVLSPLQSILMGFYQLSRLYYCFSRIES